jgi:predicted DCC family thiol-disulfide oxidoreductase YuxK
VRDRRVASDASGHSAGAHPVILFDGWCPLCIRTVRLVLRADSRAVFRFAALDSPVALDLLDRLDDAPGCGNDDIEAVRGGSSVALLMGGHVHVRSDAVLRIAAALPWPWRLLIVLRLVPRAVRNSVYEAISRSRHETWGRLDRCYLPPTDQRDRFLDIPPNEPIAP